MANDRNEMWHDEKCTADGRSMYNERGDQELAWLTGKSDPGLSKVCATRTEREILFDEEDEDMLGPVCEE